MIERPDMSEVIKLMKNVILRQEQVPFNRDFYVDENLTETLSSKNWQILVHPANEYPREIQI